MAFCGEKNYSVNTVNESFSPVCLVNNKYYSQCSVKDPLAKVRREKQHHYSKFCIVNNSNNINKSENNEIKSEKMEKRNNIDSR